MTHPLRFPAPSGPDSAPADSFDRGDTVGAPALGVPSVVWLDADGAPLAGPYPMDSNTTQDLLDTLKAKAPKALPPLWQQSGGATRFARRLASLCPDAAKVVHPFFGNGSAPFAMAKAPAEVARVGSEEIAEGLRALGRLNHKGVSALNGRDWKIDRKATQEKVEAMEPKTDVERAYQFLYRLRLKQNKNGTPRHLARYADRLAGVEFSTAPPLQVLRESSSPESLAVVVLPKGERHAEQTWRDFLQDEWEGKAIVVYRGKWKGFGDNWEYRATWTQPRFGNQPRQRLRVFANFTPTAKARESVPVEVPGFSPPPGYHLELIADGAEPEWTSKAEMPDFRATGPDGEPWPHIGVDDNGLLVVPGHGAWLTSDKEAAQAAPKDLWMPVLPQGGDLQVAGPFMAWDGVSVKSTGPGVVELDLADGNYLHLMDYSAPGGWSEWLMKVTDKPLLWPEEGPESDPDVEPLIETQEEGLLTRGKMKAAGTWFKSEEDRVTKGVVYHANKLDAHGEWVRARTLELACWDFMEKFRRVDIHHDGNIIGEAVVVECYITESGYEAEAITGGTVKIRPGDMLMAIRWPPEIWKLWKNGTLNAYSFAGWAKSVPSGAR